MREDNRRELRLRCPECQALLRIRDLEHVPESFPCADCGQFLAIERPAENLSHGNRADTARQPEPSAEGVILRRASPPSTHLPPAVVGKGAGGVQGSRRRRPQPTDGTGPQAERSPADPARASIWLRLQAAWRRIPLPSPTARWLSRGVALTLLCGLLLLYLPQKETAPPDETGDAAAQLEQPARVDPPLNDDLEGQPVAELAGQPDDLSEVPPAAIAEAAGPPVLPEEPPGPPDDEPGPARNGPAAERPAPPLARRAPVVAPQPELPVVPPINVQDRLAVRLRSYRTAAPVAVRQLLLELEEMTGVPFQLQEGNNPPAGWRERTVMIDADDVTVGELLTVVAERAGLSVQTGEAAIQVSPFPTGNPDGQPATAPGSGNSAKP
ncbi:MAG: hypothetical protein KDA79_03715 [Planctomycetaceae bacterium]|nr:hypothetical protein [Planctomycetaceae bacterium]